MKIRQILGGSDFRRDNWLYGGAFLFVLLLIRVIDALTNRVSDAFLFDSIYYISLAEKGFHSTDLVAPFAYRYATPFIAGYLQMLTGASLYHCFKWLAYVGGIVQLFGIFVVVYRLTTSAKGALISVAVIAFSLFNLKFLLFDVYRIDHLAYGFIVLGTLLAWQNRFLPLLFVTLVGVQFREFTVVPLLAYMAVRFWDEGLGSIWKQALGALIGLVLAIGLPRVLIPVKDNVQMFQLSLTGIQAVLLLVTDPKRTLNILFILTAYWLPALLLLKGEHRFRITEWLDQKTRLYLGWYTFFIFILLLLGGTDLDRFATYLFLPLAIVVAFQARAAKWSSVLLVLVIQFVFNKIWADFPVNDYDRYIDFYGGYSNLINVASVMRYVELASFLIIGRIILQFLNRNYNTA